MQWWSVVESVVVFFESNPGEVADVHCGCEIYAFPGSGLGQRLFGKPVRGSAWVRGLLVVSGLKWCACTLHVHSPSDRAWFYKLSTEERMVFTAGGIWHGSREFNFVRAESIEQPDMFLFHDRIPTLFAATHPPFTLPTPPPPSLPCPFAVNSQRNRSQCDEDNISWIVSAEKFHVNRSSLSWYSDVFQDTPPPRPPSRCAYTPQPQSQ